MYNIFMKKWKLICIIITKSMILQDVLYTLIIGIHEQFKICKYRYNY
nr:ALPV-318 [Albatrosspox virus]